MSILNLETNHQKKKKWWTIYKANFSESLWRRIENVTFMNEIDRLDTIEMHLSDNIGFYR